MKKKFFLIALLIVAAIFLIVFKNNKKEVAAPVPIVETPAQQGTSTIIAKLYTPTIVNGITINAWAVTEDSRCPSGVQCIQAGRVKVAAGVYSASGTSTHEFEIGKSYATESFEITLQKVDPYPVYKHKTTDDEYRFTFTVVSHILNTNK